jgi:hypothetical protein
MGEMRNIYKITSEKPAEGLGVDKIILEWILGK